MKGVMVFLAMALGFSRLAYAEPVPFEEVSLLLRMRESHASILKQVSQRTLVRPLTPQQEAVLKAQGASDSFLQALRNPALIASSAEANAFEARREKQRKPEPVVDTPPVTPGEPHKDEFQILNLEFGRSVNLSQWGGPNIEVSFVRWKKAGESERVSAVVSDNTRVFNNTSISTGAVAGPFGSSAGTTVTQNSYSPRETVAINLSNPLFVKGLPVNLYRVYGAGGVEIYYCNISVERANAAKIAVRVVKR